MVKIKGWLLNELLLIMPGLILGTIFCVAIINFAVLLATENKPKPKKEETKIRQLQKEIEYQNKVNYNLQWKYVDLQHQKDTVELYLWQYGTNQITKEELAAKIEAIEPRSFLLKIKKHKLSWEK